MANASDDKLACASAKAMNDMNDIMRLDSAECEPLLIVVMPYFLCILEDNKGNLEDSDLHSDDNYGAEIDCGSGPGEF